MFGKIKDGTVYVTEGILKAEIAWMCTGNPYIGVPGVSNHKGLETVLRKLKEQGLKRVYECYDMDKMMELSCKHDEKVRAGNVNMEFICIMENAPKSAESGT